MPGTTAPRSTAIFSLCFFCTAVPTCTVQHVAAVAGHYARHLGQLLALCRGLDRVHDIQPQHDNAAKSPPRRTAQPPSLNLAITNHTTNLNLSLTSGLTDDRQIATYIVDIQPCDRKGHCLKPGACEPILLGGSHVPMPVCRHAESRVRATRATTPTSSAIWVVCRRASWHDKRC